MHAAIWGFGYYGESGSDTGDVEAIGGVLHHQLVTARRRRRQKISAGVIPKIVVVAENADKLVQPIVVRRKIGVRDRPIIAESIAALGLEVVPSKAKRNSSPVVGAATDHTCPPPPELGALSYSKRLTLQLPAADACVKLTERAIRS